MNHFTSVSNEDPVSERIIEYSQRIRVQMAAIKQKKMKYLHNTTQTTNPTIATLASVSSDGNDQDSLINSFEIPIEDLSDEGDKTIISFTLRP